MTRTKIALLSSVIALLLGACATPQSDAYVAATEEDTGEGLICENKPNVGSRLSKRVCTTAAEREEMAARARESREHLDQRGSAPESLPGPAGN